MKKFTLLFSTALLLLQHSTWSQQQQASPQGLESVVFNYTSFSVKNQRVIDAWDNFNKDHANHPEKGIMYSYTPNQRCIELINKRTEHEKFYVDIDKPSHIYKQDGYEPLHYKKNNQWITVDRRIQPLEAGIYEASNQMEPTGFDVNKKKSYIQTQSTAKVEFNNWKLYGEKGGALSLLAEPDWSHYTAGEDGMYITNIFPGIDAEMLVRKGGIKTNFIVKKEYFSSYTNLIFKDHFESTSDIQMEFRHNNATQVQKGDVFISFNGKSIVDIKKAYAYAKNAPQTATDLMYSIESNELGIIVPNSFIGKYIKDGDVVIDPLVTGSSTMAAGSMGSKYNASCSYVNSCDYTMNVTPPSGVTFTDVKWTFAYLATAPCATGNGAFRFRGGTCEPTYIWFCAGTGTGGCGGTVSEFGIFSSCLPVPSCAPHTPIPFTARIWRGCVNVDTGCATSCISGLNNWVITIEGRSVEHTNKIVISTPKDSICANTSVIFSKVTSNGVPPYSATNWSTDRSGTPSIGTGDSITRTFPASGIYWIYARTTDACSNLALDSQRIYVSMPLTVVDTSSPVICLGQSVNINASSVTKGNALDFSSSSRQYVSVPSASSNSLSGRSSFTVSAWVYPRTNGHQHLLFKGLGCSSWHSWTLGIGGFEAGYEWWPKKLVFSYLTANGSGVNAVATVDTVVPNQWVHVAVTYDGSNLRIYLNGVLNATAAISGGPWNSSENLYMGLDPGCLSAGRMPYNGKLDEVQIWGTTRTATEIFNSYRGLAVPSSTGLLAYYRFDENNGANVYDVTTGANHGTIIGSVAREIPSTAPIDNNIGGAVTYAWSPTTGLSPTTGASVTANPTTSTNYTITTTHTATGCTNTSMVRVQVNPLPTISGTLSACVGQTSTLTGSASPHPTTPWTSSNTAIATVSSTGVVTGVSAGIVTITYRNTNNCAQTATFTVNPLPTISGTLNTCIGSTTTLIGSATAHPTTPWTSSNTAVATISSTGLVSGLSVGTTTITYQNNNNCTQTATFTVNPLPTISGTLSACVGQSSTLTGSASPHPTTPWASLNTAIATVSSTGVVSGVSAGTVTIVYQNNNNCIQTVVFTVNPLPTISGTLNTCIGGTSTLTGSASPHPTTPWASSNTAIATVSSTGVVSGVSAGTVTITYQNTNNCIITASFTVNPLPTISGTLVACVGQSSTLTGTATAHATTPWTSSNTAIATVSATGVVTGVSAGTATITYRNTNNCTQTATFTVNPLPAAPGVTTPVTYCQGATTTFLGTPTGTSIRWYTTATGGTSSTTTPLPSSTTPGIIQYFVTQTDGLSCESAPRTVINVVINPRPVAVTATPASSTTICAGDSVILNGSTSVFSNFGSTPYFNGASASGAIYTCDCPNGSAAVGYEGRTGAFIDRFALICKPISRLGVLGSTTSTTLTNGSSAGGGGAGPFTFSGSDLMVGARVRTETFFAGSFLGEVLAYGQNLSYIRALNDNTISPVTLTGFGGTSASATLGTGWAPNGTVITGMNSYPTSYSSGVSFRYSPIGAFIYSFSWSSAPTTDTNSSLVVKTGGAYTLTVTNSLGCSATSSPVNVTVNPLPTITGTFSTCVGQGTFLSGSPSPHPTTPWTSSNTAIATVSSTGLVSGISAGTVTITYRNTNNCTQSVSFTVNPLPVAPTVVSPIDLCVGVPASPLSATGINLKWYTIAIGGIASTSLTPNISSVGTTNYYVSQTTLLGCEGPRATLTVNVRPSPTVTLSPKTAPAFVYCKNDSVTLKATASPVISYEWYKGPSIISGATADTLSVKVTDNYRVIVKDIYGCADTETVAVIENPLTPPKLSPDEVFMCDGVDIMLYCTPGDSRYRYEWFFNGIDMGLDTTTNKTPINVAGVYDLRVTDFYRCVLNTNSVTVNTYPAVVKPVITRIGKVLTVTATYTTYLWFRNGKVIPGATAKSFTMTYDGDYYVVVTDKNGCEATSDTLNYNSLSIGSQSAIKQVKIYPNPTQNWVSIDAPMEVNVIVTDMVGKQIIVVKNAKTVNLENYADGTYAIRITDKEGNYLGSEKIVKMTR